MKAAMQNLKSGSNCYFVVSSQLHYSNLFFVLALIYFQGVVRLLHSNLPISI